MERVRSRRRRVALDPMRGGIVLHNRRKGVVASGLVMQGSEGRRRQARGEHVGGKDGPSPESEKAEHEPPQRSYGV